MKPIAQLLDITSYEQDHDETSWFTPYHRGGFNLTVKTGEMHSKPKHSVETWWLEPMFTKIARDNDNFFTVDPVSGTRTQATSDVWGGFLQIFRHLTKNENHQHTVHLAVARRWYGRKADASSFIPVCYIEDIPFGKINNVKPRLLQMVDHRAPQYTNGDYLHHAKILNAEFLKHLSTCGEGYHEYDRPAWTYDI